jgi:hypothetical protein
MRTEPIVGLSITAGAIESTGNSGDDTHQFRMGALAFVHFTPEVAAQWIGALTPIASKEGK